MEKQKIGVPIVVVNERSEVLMGKRKGVYGDGHYGMPGGRIELAESIEQTAIRELREETGLELTGCEYIGVVRELQADYNFIHFGVAAKGYRGEVTNVEPDKCEGWEWHPLGNLPSNIMRSHAAVIEMYKNKSNPSLREILIKDPEA